MRPGPGGILINKANEHPIKTQDGTNKTSVFPCISHQTTCWVDGGFSPEIPDLAALGYLPRQDERGQMTVGGWRVGVGGGMLTFHVTCSRC